MKKYKPQQEVVLYGTGESIHIPEIKVRYNKGKTHEKINSSKTTYDLLKRLYGREISIQEQLIILYFDNGLNVLGYYKHTKGTPVSVLADVPMILGIAVKAMARSILLSHNHPSGKPSPSENDRVLTKGLTKAAKTLNLKLLDHIIVTKDNGYYSFADEENLFSGTGKIGATGIEQQLCTEINNQLSKVTPFNAPNVYRLLQTPGGYANMEQRAINLVVRDKITPSACIPQIENEL